MPGIDKSRFLNIGSEDELLCGICLGVFVNPLVTQCCQQIYCSDCIKQWIKASKTCPNDRISLTNNKLSQPPRVFINSLNKQKLKCDFYERGCLEEVVYGRFKQHIRDCRYNEEAICSDCGKKNGQRDEHKCVDNLVAKHQCLQEMQTNYMVLLNSNKQLIDKNATLENELLISKQKYDEKLKEVSLTDNLIEDKRRLEDSNKELSDKCEHLETEMFNMMKYFDETIKSLNDERLDELKSEQNQYNKLLDTHRHLESSYKQAYEKCSRYVLELCNVKTKSDETITELNEQLKQKIYQIDMYSPLIKENKRLNENIELLVKNIDKLSLLKQTNLEKTRIGLKINDIYNLKKLKMIEGKPVYFGGLWWNINAKLLVDDNLEYLSFYLVCNRKIQSEVWSCIASIEMSIIPQNKVDVVFKNVHKLSCVYSNKVNSFGYDKFMPWFMVMDEKYGYVKDDSILLKVCASIW